VRPHDRFRDLSDVLLLRDLLSDGLGDVGAQLVDGDADAARGNPRDPRDPLWKYGERSWSAPKSAETNHADV
jgi:hypothetical protein